MGILESVGGAMPWHCTKCGMPDANENFRRLMEADRAVKLLREVAADSDAMNLLAPKDLAQRIRDYLAQVPMSQP